MNKLALFGVVSISIACTGCSTISASINEQLNTANYCAPEERYIEIFNEKVKAVGSELVATKVQDLKYDNKTYNCHLEIKLSDGSLLGGHMYAQSGSSVIWEPDIGHDLTPLEVKIVEAQDNAANSRNAQLKAERAATVNKFLEMPVSQRSEFCDLAFRLAVDRGAVFTKATAVDFYRNCIYKGSQIY